MELQQAQLGQVPNMNIGGYIPAGPERKSAKQAALEAFLMGAASGIGSHAVNAAFTPDVSREMAADKTLQEAGTNVQKKGMLQRFFNPTTEEQYDRAKRTAGEQIAQKNAAATDTKRLDIASKSADATKDYQQKELGLRGEQLKASKEEAALQRFMQGQHNTQQFILGQTDNERQGKLAKAQMEQAGAVTKSAELQNRMLEKGQQQQALTELLDPKNGEKNQYIKQAAQSLGAEGKTLTTFPTTEAYQKAVMDRANTMLHQWLSQQSPIVPPTEQPSLLNNLIQGAPQAMTNTSW